MNSAASTQQAASRLVRDGLKELELLFGTVLCLPSEPILIADDDRNCLNISSAAGKLLGLPKGQIVGHRLDDLIEPSSRSKIAQGWPILLERGEHEGAFRLSESDGHMQEVRYVAKSNVLPGRHVLFLLDKTSAQRFGPVDDGADEIPPWRKDYAFFILNADGQVVA